MNNCNHQFFQIKTDIDYQIPTPIGSTTSNASMQVPNSIHAVVVCAYCGQIRRIYLDGKIVIEKDHGEIKIQN